MMQVFIEIPYSDEVFELIGTLAMAENDQEDDLMSDTEFDDFYFSYLKKMKRQVMDDAQSWINKYMIEGTKVKSAESTYNETIRFEIEV